MPNPRSRASKSPAPKSRLFRVVNKKRWLGKKFKPTTMPNFFEILQGKNFPGSKINSKTLHELANYFIELAEDDVEYSWSKVLDKFPPDIRKHILAEGAQIIIPPKIVSPQSPSEPASKTPRIMKFDFGNNLVISVPIGTSVDISLS